LKFGRKVIEPLNYAVVPAIIPNPNRGKMFPTQSRKEKNGVQLGDFPLKPLKKHEATEQVKYRKSLGGYRFVK
jgi:hypothetical protein